MQTQDSLIPQLTPRMIVVVLLAGAAATVAFDLFGQTISPLFNGVLSPFLGAKLAPVPLASQVLATVTGIPGTDLSALGLPHGIHTLTGVIAYPLGWLLIARPIYRAVMPGLPWVVPAIAYGIVLWVFALYFMAHLIAGNPAFLGWGPLTWVALWGHIVFAVVAAWVIAWGERVTGA